MNLKHRKEHSRYLYNLQNSDSFGDTEESDTSDSDESSSSVNVNNWRKGPHSRRSVSASRTNTRYSSQPPPYISASERKRMSIITGKYFDIPVHEEGYAHYEHSVTTTKAFKRRFFQSGSTDMWDESSDVDAIVNTHFAASNGFSHGVSNLTSVMERGGKTPDTSATEDEDEEEEEEDDVEMSVDS